MWTAAMNVSERIFMNEIFASYIPSFTYRLVNVHQYTNEQLLIHEDEGIRRRSDRLFDKDDRRQSDGKLMDNCHMTKEEAEAFVEKNW